MHLGSEVVFDGATWPGFVHTVDHPDGLVLVDTGMIDSTPELDDEWSPTPHPLSGELVSRVAVVVNTHLHFDHCGGNRLFAGRVPIHVQRIELEDARAEILPGVRLVPAPGHTRGHQIVVVETDDGPVVLGGDVGYSFAEIGRGDTPGRRLVLELAAPTYLAHSREPHVPRANA